MDYLYAVFYQHFSNRGISRIRRMTIRVKSRVNSSKDIDELEKGVTRVVDGQAYLTGFTLIGEP